MCNRGTWTCNARLPTTAFSPPPISVNMASTLGFGSPTRPSRILYWNASVQARRPISTFTTIEESIPAGFLTYNGFQAKFEHRFSGGVYLLNSFAWSQRSTMLQAISIHPTTTIRA